MSFKRYLKCVFRILRVVGGAQDMTSTCVSSLKMRSIHAACFYRRSWARATAAEDSTWWASEMFHENEKSHASRLQGSMRVVTNPTASRFHRANINTRFKIPFSDLNAGMKKKKDYFSLTIRSIHRSKIILRSDMFAVSSGQHISGRVFLDLNRLIPRTRCKMTEGPTA